MTTRAIIIGIIIGIAVFLIEQQIAGAFEFHSDPFRAKQDWTAATIQDKHWDMNSPSNTYIKVRPANIFEEKDHVECVLTDASGGILDAVKEKLGWRRLVKFSSIYAIKHHTGIWCRSV